MKSFLLKFACAALIFGSVFGIVDSLDKTNAQSVPIKTFRTSYKGYTPSLAKKTKYSPAQKCTTTKPIYGAKPAAAGNYPVLLYVHGTFGDIGGNAEGKAFVKWAASQGFIALALTYNSSSTNSDSGYAGHAYCMFDQIHPANGVPQACAATGADCSKGIAVAGFSQGAVIGAISKNYNQNVKAVWAIGLSAAIMPNDVTPPYLVASPNGTRVLPNDKLAINMGQASSCGGKDLCSYDLPSLKVMSGLDCGTSFQCIQDGHGYYVVSNAEVTDKKADHCYWEGNRGCRIFSFTGEDGFKPESTTMWSMATNLNWLRSQLNT